MDPKLVQYFQEVKALELEKRDAHLVSLGLIDESKTTKVECTNDAIPFDAEYDPVKEKFFMTKKFPIDVTDEEYAEICKYNPPKTLQRVSNMEKDMLTIKRIMVFFTWIWGIGFVLGLLLMLFAL
ncbi:MAG: hypothetical protein R3Y38_06465 [Rikenellaceae bacterium]